MMDSITETTQPSANEAAQTAPLTAMEETPQPKIDTANTTATTTQAEASRNPSLGDRFKGLFGLSVTAPKDKVSQQPTPISEQPERQPIQPIQEVPATDLGLKDTIEVQPIQPTPEDPLPTVSTESIGNTATPASAEPVPVAASSIADSQPTAAVEPQVNNNSYFGSKIADPNKAMETSGYAVDPLATTNHVTVETAPTANIQPAMQNAEPMSQPSVEPVAPQLPSSSLETQIPNPTNGGPMATEAPSMVPTVGPSLNSIPEAPAAPVTVATNEPNQQATGISYNQDQWK